MNAFDGQTYNEPRDGTRLAHQLALVRQYVSDGQWHTLAEIAAACHCPEASASARLRDCRKSKHGSHTIEREYVASGLWRYRMVCEPVQLELCA